MTNNTLETPAQRYKTVTLGYPKSNESRFEGIDITVSHPEIRDVVVAFALSIITDASPTISPQVRFVSGNSEFQRNIHKLNSNDHTLGLLLQAAFLNAGWEPFSQYHEPHGNIFIALKKLFTT